MTISPCPATRRSRGIVAPLLTVCLLAALVPAQAADNQVVREPERAFIGIRIGKASAEGVQVHSVVAGSAADRAGLAAGDVIVGLGSNTVGGPDGLHRLLADLKPGERVGIAVRRKGVEQRLDVELGGRAGGLKIDLDGTYTAVSPRMRGTVKGTVYFKHPSHVEDTYVCGADNCRFSGDDLVWYRVDCIGRGCPAYTIDFYDRPVLGVRLIGGGGANGTLVGEVYVGSPAWEAGVEVGDVIVGLDDTPIERQRDLRQALTDTEGGMMELSVVRDEEPLRLRLYMPRD